VRAEEYLLTALLVVSLACGPSPVPTPTEETAYTTVTAELSPVEVRAPFLGTVADARVVELKAQALGRVASIEVPDGGQVAAGAVILRIGGERFEAAANAVQTALAAANQTVAARSSQLERARRRAAAHLAGPTEVANADAALADAKSALADAEARANTLAAAREVRAPFAGILTSRRVSPGQEVTTGEILASLSDPASTRVEARVMADSALTITVDQQATVTTPSGAEIVARVAGVAAPASPDGSVFVWLSSDAVAKLRPGTAVSGSIVVDRHQAVVVPTSAVVRDDDDRPWVFVGQAAPFDQRAVSLGIERNGKVELLTGLAAGEPVVVDGAYQLLWSSFAHSFTAPD